MISINCYASNPKPAHFHACLQSILTQSYPAWELVLLDDASVPPLSRYLSEWGMMDERIHLIRHEENYGMLNVHFNWNECLRASRGDLTTAMGSDDIMWPDRLRKVVEVFARYPSLDLLHHNALFIDDEGMLLPATYEEQTIKRRWRKDRIIRTPVGHRGFVDSGERTKIYPQLLNGHNLFAHPTVVMRRSLLDRVGFSEWGPCGDYQYWIRCAHDRSVIIRWLPEDLMSYRMHDGSGCVYGGQTVYDQSMKMLTYWKEHHL